MTEKHETFAAIQTAQQLTEHMAAVSPAALKRRMFIVRHPGSEDYTIIIGDSSTAAGIARAIGISPVGQPASGQFPAETLVEFAFSQPLVSQVSGQPLTNDWRITLKAGRAPKAELFQEAFGTIIAPPEHEASLSHQLVQACQQPA